jgi:hypothetical protein
MKAKVTEEGVLIPKELLEGMDEVEIRKEDGVILIMSVTPNRSIFNIGKDPIEEDITDAARNHDRYIYNGQ